MASGEEGIPSFEYDIAYDDLVMEGEIGKGGFGTVYLASYLGAKVAVKMIPQPQTPEEKLFMKREVAILKGLRHPNCVQLVGLTTDRNGNLNIVMDYVAGGNLRSVLKDPNRKLDWHWRMSIASDIAGAMAYLHAKNILFRDLKSKNVLVEESKAKLCDFGLARSNTSLAPRPMTICGTDDWMAPEVILGMDYNSTADIFSYGIVLLEIITRLKVSSQDLQRSPLDAFGLNEDKAQKLVPQDCPTFFSQLCFECSAYEPEKRPQFKLVVQKLAAAIKELPKEQPKTVSPRPAPKAVSPNPAKSTPPKSQPPSVPSSKPTPPSSKPNPTPTKVTPTPTKTFVPKGAPAAKAAPPKTFGKK